MNAVLLYNYRMTRHELIEFVKTLYPQTPWGDDGKAYKNTAEQRRLVELKKCRNYNYGKGLRRAVESKGYIFINENRAQDACFEYRVPCEKVPDILDDDRELLASLGGKRTEVYLYVSKFVNVFTAFCLRTELETTENGEVWTFEEKRGFDGDAGIIFDAVRECLTARGCEYIDVEETYGIVPGIGTEFTARGETTLFHLLFTPMHEHCEKKTVI